MIVAILKIICLVSLNSPLPLLFLTFTNMIIYWRRKWWNDLAFGTYAVCSSVSLLFLGSKRLSYLSPWLCRKQCVQTFNVFDFLKDIVSKVPDLGGSVATGDDQTVTKRRFVFGYCSCCLEWVPYADILFILYLGKSLKTMILTTTRRPREIKW